MNDDEDTLTSNDRRMDEGQADYAFEGFKVDFNERVALVPPAIARMPS